MTQENAGRRFEHALLEAVREPSRLRGEPALAPIVGLISVLKRATHPNPHWSGPALAVIRDLHLAYEFIRNKDVNRPSRKPSRVTRFKPEYLPDSLAGVRDLAAALWPVLPLVSFLHYTRGSSSWSAAEQTARLHEYLFVLMCTKPALMSPWLYHLARAVLAPKKRRYPLLDVDEAAEAVTASFERRKLPVARYRARSSSIPEAAATVREYMTRAIRQRFKDVARSLVARSGDVVPASTARRWRNKYGQTVSTPAEVQAFRTTMKERRTHVPDGRISIAMIAKASKRSRTTVTSELRKLETEHGFEAEQTPDDTFILTPTQAKLVFTALEALPRRRRR